MVEFTQGTIISNVRSNKYPNVITYGITITARCDLANDKIDKIHFLTAIPLKGWIYSKVGFCNIMKNLSDKLNDELQKKLSKYKLDWEEMSRFSKEEYSFVLAEYITKAKEREHLVNLFSQLKDLERGQLSKENKLLLFKSETDVVVNELKNIISGKDFHLIYIPKSEVDGDIDNNDGLIIDLQELDYLSLEVAQKLSRGEIDTQNAALTIEQKAEYNKQFFVLESPGYAWIEGVIRSPWIEYIMQHFANCFIRIGVDNMDAQEVNTLVGRIMEELI